MSFQADIEDEKIEIALVMNKFKESDDIDTLFSYFRDLSASGIERMLQSLHVFDLDVELKLLESFMEILYAMLNSRRYFELVQVNLLPSCRFLACTYIAIVSYTWFSSC